MNSKVAIVTGAGRGIGRAIAEMLADEGRTVIGCGRSARPGDLGRSIRWLETDVADPDAAGRLIEFASSQASAIDVVVNNAGIQVEKTVTESSDDDWDAVVGTNCRGVFNICRACIPVMTSTGGGSIINIGSISGKAADHSMALYNASKGFVHALTRSVAVDHGPHIRCNAICPGWIATEMADAAFALAGNPAAAKKDAVARHPAGRLGRPDDIARIVSWLASAGSGFVTGQCITADGGLLAASPIRTDLQ